MAVHPRSQLEALGFTVHEDGESWYERDTGVAIPAYPYVKSARVWVGVHKRAGHTKDEQKNPWRVNCDRPFCYYSVSARMEKDAQRLYDTHSCPHPGGLTTYGWGLTVIQLDKVWERLDNLVRILIEEELLAETKALKKAEARGLAEALAVFMVPHFDTADKIAAEAKVRYDMRKAGRTDYDTPGLKSMRYKDTTDMPKSAADKTAAAVAALAPDLRSAIGNANGMFEADDIARMYGTTVAVVKAVWAQVG